HAGGNTPQALVNWAAARNAASEHHLALLCGAEFLGSLMKALKSGGDLSLYGGEEREAPEMWGEGRFGYTKQEGAHGINAPISAYPLYENGLRAHRRRGIAAHRAAIGRLMAPFTEIAARNPYSWFPTARSAEEIATEGPSNRMIGFPYTKYMNAIIQVDQSAAVILASSARADALGVPHEKRVYLHGCSDTTELWHMLDRVDYHSSPAIRVGAQKAFSMAGKGQADMRFFDLYSCFPCAVQIAAAEIGVAEDDARGLTVTGGLPYFGGPGNNYVMHSIAEMAQRLRGAPGAFGLVTANGWFLTKHAMGVYSTTPTQGAWARENPKAYQKEIDALAHPNIVLEPTGPAKIETYTVMHGRSGGRRGIIIGRDAQDRRFVARPPDDERILDSLERSEGVGRIGTVTSEPGGLNNIFTPS
ncbi:MAG: acetyl-CoA acetyltransferase, partial [Hyphomonadaceae bacterium]